MTAPAAQGSTVRAILAIGGNLGDRQANISGAIEAIRLNPGVSVLQVSPTVESHALTLEGVDPGVPSYLNCVLEVETSLEPEALLSQLNQIEADFGRERLERWASRTLDIDIITYGDIFLDTATLSIPHPRAHERAFVLVPWALMHPEAALPGRGSVQELAAPLSSQVWVKT